MSVAAAAFVTLAAVQTDTTLAVPPGTRLEVENFAGDIAVGTWKRDEVRIVAQHGPTTEVEIEQAGPILRVEGASRRGLPSVDYRITAPVWMDLDLSGVSTDVS